MTDFDDDGTYVKIFLVIVILISLLSIFVIIINTNPSKFLLFLIVLAFMHYLLRRNLSLIFMPLFLISLANLLNDFMSFEKILMIGQIFSLVLISFWLYHMEKKSYIIFFVLAIIYISKDLFSLQIVAWKVANIFFILLYLISLFYNIFLGVMLLNEHPENELLYKRGFLLGSFAASLVSLLLIFYFTGVNKIINEGFTEPETLANKIYERRMKSYNSDPITTVCNDGWEIYGSDDSEDCSEHGGISELKPRKKPTMENAIKSAARLSWLQ